MMDVNKIAQSIEKVLEASGATVRRIGASEKSDALYINATLPKEVCQEYGVLDTYNILIRVSNHYNDTFTDDRMAADFFFNLYDSVDYDDCISDLTEFASECEVEEVA